MLSYWPYSRSHTKIWTDRPTGPVWAGPKRPKMAHFRPFSLVPLPFLYFLEFSRFLNVIRKITFRASQKFENFCAVTSSKGSKLRSNFSEKCQKFVLSILAQFDPKMENICSFSNFITKLSLLLPKTGLKNPKP